MIEPVPCASLITARSAVHLSSRTSGAPEENGPIGPKTGLKGKQNMKKLKNRVFHKNWFFIQVGIGEVWGCPGGEHGPYEDIVSNFGGIWSYKTSKSQLFNI